MSFLKAQIDKLKAKQGEQGGQKWVKKGEVEQQREKEYVEEQKRREEERQRRQQQKLQELYEFYAQEEKAEEGRHQGSEIKLEIPLSKAEVINRLRKFGREATLFGESEEDRYRRMLALEEIFGEDYRKEHKDETLSSFMGSQDNDFQKFKQPNHKPPLVADAEKKKARVEGEEEKKEEGGRVVQDAQNLVDNLVGRYAHEDELKIGDRTIDELIELKEKNHQIFRNVRKFENQCKKHPQEEKCKLVYLWCQKMMKCWEEEVLSRPASYLQTAEGKIEVGMHKQCWRYVKPLVKLLKKNSVSEEIIDGLYLIVQYCLMKEYVRAHDKYLELAIGNAPWPMGVTMVGIHERSGRSRIFSSQVAHILNDETQRKYLQSIKRMLTVCQRVFPTDPSKTVRN